jgi:hypothetical protein
VHRGTHTKARIIAVTTALSVVLAGGSSAQGVPTSVGAGGGAPGTALNFTLVGQNALSGFELDGNSTPRGMNSAPAIFDHFVYVGNRSDGSNSCGDSDPGPGVTPVLTPTNPDGTCTHVHPGILVVDVADPTSPTVVGEFGTEFVSGANEGQTARELRVWPEEELLMVMYFRCSRVIHACPQTAQSFQIRFFDLAVDPVNPPLKASYTPSALPHEMYLWLDPKDESRALLWLSTPTTSANPSVPNLIITDISEAREGIFTEIARGNWNQFFPGASNPANYDFDLALHSMTPSVDGRRTYLAYLRGGFGVLDTSKVANNLVPAGTVENLNDDLLTRVPFPTWGTGPQCPGHTAAGCAESHSAVPFPGRPFALTIDEVYGTFTVDSFGWPWGWARTWNVSRPRQPRMLSEYRIFQNTEAFRPSVDPATEQFTSYSSHNPTLTRNLALDAWHSGGLQAIDIEDPGAPAQTGWFSPTPAPQVALEDPALSRGPNKVVMWSFPIVNDGLIYVVDIRNGLFVLRYTGPRAGEVSGLTFLEGNSNLGDALRIASSAG